MGGAEALLPLLLFAVVIWLLIVRPARNRQRQMASLQAELGVGSEVMLTSGVFGTVTWLGEETVRVEIAPGTEVRMPRQAIGRVLADEERIRMANESADTSDAEDADLDASDGDDVDSDDADSDIEASDADPADAQSRDKGD